MSLFKAYLRKQTEARAAYYDGTLERAKSIIAEIGDDHAYLRDIPGDNFILVVRTQEGEYAAHEGDWIMQDTMGHYYPCKDEHFQKVYYLQDPMPEVDTA